MSSLPSPNIQSNNPFKGPDDGDPLTPKELSILLAIPRTAQTSPNTMAFRLPLGPDPAQGWVDVNYSQTCAIVSRLASIWKSRLDTLLGSAGPGTTICMFVQPGVHAIFHYFAFRALGCTMQYLYSCLGISEICSKLRESNCDAILHSGMEDAWIRAMKAHFGEKLVALPEEEFAHQLARDEKEGRAGLAPPWPEPRRPTPALILHSSGTTGVPKLLRLSLFWYTLALPTDNVTGTSAVYSSGTVLARSKATEARPHLIFSPPFWGSYHYTLITRILMSTPITFCHFRDAGNLPPKQLMRWARALGNIYGISEFGRSLSARTPPYNHLRPDLECFPLVLPISEPDSNGSRQVQLWLPLSASPRLAHLYVRGGAQIKIEPFPGEGVHKGELAVNTHDIFQEVRDGESGFAYISLGRGDDMIRLARFGQMNASRFETELASIIYARHKEGLGGRWMIDTVQLFGNALPHTALVVQLCRSAPGEGTVQKEVLEELYGAVEQVNEKLCLGPTRVDPKRRMLVIAPEGEVYGPNADSVRGRQLELTHKRSLQRWKNVQNFKAWLDGLSDG
ncbi:hypothetical protein OPQ81_000966 [Rhizoctonia solani]|nr:hypothetical protein OPQ81_000966 [Rhizoctonia solani]